MYRLSFRSKVLRQLQRLLWCLRRMQAVDKYLLYTQKRSFGSAFLRLRIC